MPSKNSTEVPSDPRYKQELVQPDSDADDLGLLPTNFAHKTPEHGMWLAILLDAINGWQCDKDAEDMRWLFEDNRVYIGSRKWIEQEVLDGVEVLPLLKSPKFRWKSHLAYISLSAQWGVKTLSPYEIREERKIRALRKKKCADHNVY
jgi:hypothetical protein